MALADLNKPEVKEFISKPLLACIATINPDGSPHQTLVWYSWDGQRFLVSTAKTRVKYRNLLHNANAGLLITDPSNPYRFVSVSGPADMTEEKAAEFIVEMAVRYQGEERGRAAAVDMAKLPRVTISIAPQHVIVSGF